MANSLRRFWAAYLMELRLLCLHWTYPLLHLLWAFFLFGVYQDGMTVSPGDSLLRDMGRISTGLVSLVAMFVAGASASRSQRSRFHGLEGALPTGAEVHLGRWLAALTGLMGGMVEPVLFSARLGPFSALVDALPLFLASALITLAFTTAAAWWLVTALGGSRWLYLVLTGGWLTFLVGPRVLPWHLRYPWLSVLDFTRQGTYDYTEAWGMISEGPKPLLFNILYLGLTGLFLGLILWQAHRRRLKQAPLVPALLVAISLGVTLVSGGRYISLLNQWAGQEAAVDRPTTPARETIDAYRHVLGWMQESSPHAPVPFRPVVTAPEGMVLHSNLPLVALGRFEANHASWTFLFASRRIAVEQIGNLRLAIPRAQLETARPVAVRYQEALAYLQRFFPDLSPTGTSGPWLAPTLTPAPSPTPTTSSGGITSTRLMPKPFRPTCDMIAPWPTNWPRFTPSRAKPG